MSQARKSRCASRTLHAVLVATAGLAVLAPGAGAAPAVEEYSLNLPGGEEPASEPAEPAPAPAPAPYVPPPVAVPEAPTTAPVIVEPPEPKPRDVAASRRDVIFQLPASARTDPATVPAAQAANPGSAGVPILLVAFAALAAACVLLTLWRLRRFSRGRARAPGPAARPTPRATGHAS